MHIVLTRCLSMLLLFGSLAAAASAAEAPPIFVGGQYIRAHAIDDDGHVLVPVRGVFAAFGASVVYTAPRFVVVRKNGVVVAGLVVGGRHAVVGNRPRWLAAAPSRLGGRVYVPLRAIAEMAGASVVYSMQPRIVDIRAPRNEIAPPPPPFVERQPDPAPAWAWACVSAIFIALGIEIGRRVRPASKGADASPR